MSGEVTFIGFGEAAMAFAEGLPVGVRAYDRKTYVGKARSAKIADYRRLNVSGEISNAAAVSGARIVISLVTAGRAIAAARETARRIADGALYLDMNSVAPDTKRAAARAISAAGGRYVDVAVLAPVLPLRRSAPLLVAGVHASAAAEALASLGFDDVTIAGRSTGEASAIKMVRSVMVKGIEALTAECLLAAEAAGVAEAVLTSLEASWPGAGWRRRSDYNLGRMMMHGLRRAEEMGEVVRTLDALGTGSDMARATTKRQRAIGELALSADGYIEGKLSALLGSMYPGSELGAA